MAYRYDDDLEFLQNCSNEDLKQLANILIYDKDGTERLTEELSRNPSYYYAKKTGDFQSCYKEISGEIQCYGANSFMTIFRGGKGVLYKEILCDVCDKLKVPYNKGASVERIEDNMFQKLTTDAIEKMSDEEIRELGKSVGIKNISNLTGPALAATFITIFKAGGFKSYQLTVIIANAVLRALIGRGFTFGANATITRTAGILVGPIGWIITGAWTAFDIASPAYRVTIPAIIEIAYLRKKNSGNYADEINFG